MPPVGFEPTISAGERPQTYALDRAATGSGDIYIYTVYILYYIYYIICNKFVCLKDLVLCGYKSVKCKKMHRDTFGID